MAATVFAHIQCHLPQRALIKRLVPLQAVLMFYLVQACVLTLWTAQGLQGFSM